MPDTTPLAVVLTAIALVTAPLLWIAARERNDFGVIFGLVIFTASLAGIGELVTR